MTSIPAFDTNGTYPNSYTSDLIDVNDFNRIHVLAFYNATAEHGLTWYASPGVQTYFEKIDVPAGTAVFKSFAVKGKYLSITYDPSVTPFVMRTSHIFYT